MIFDRVRSTDPEFKKTWLLQAMRRPEVESDRLIMTHGEGRLFVQTLLPKRAEIELRDGDELYQYDGQRFEPTRRRNPAPRCRVEISPSEPARTAYFLHVLTATDADGRRPPKATVRREEGRPVVTLDGTEIAFELERVSGWVEREGRRRAFAEQIVKNKPYPERGSP